MSEISNMPEKLSMVDGDFLTIVDSEDLTPATQNKKVQRQNTGLQSDAPAQNSLGNNGTWVPAGGAAVLDVGTGAGDVAAGDAPAANVSAHETTFTHSNLPTNDQKGAMTAASAPSAGNAFATLSDLAAQDLVRERQVLNNQSTTVSWNWNGGDSGFTVTLTGNADVTAPLNPPTMNPGQYRDGHITITQDATGGRVPTWNAVWKNAPTLADGEIAANAVVDMAFMYDGTDYVLGAPVTRT